MKTISARERLEAALVRIEDPKGEGARACLTIYREQARRSRRRRCARPGRYFARGARRHDHDNQGSVRRRRRSHARRLQGAGRGRKTRRVDAPVVRRLRAGGAVIVAKTNMSEFAYSGIGANPHFGTPGNPADRKRVPGGSSSGAAVAAADGMCEIAIGTDTGGSCRIPARSAASSASSQAGSAFRPTAHFRCPTVSTRSGRSRARSKPAPRPTP